MENIKFNIANALSGVYYLATTDKDQPHVRPFDGAVVLEDKFYIGTNKNKEVFKQILKNPKIEIFSMETGVVRFTAEAYAVEDDSLNAEIYDALHKDYNDSSVALELKKAKGTFTDSMGEKTEFSF